MPYYLAFIGYVVNDKYDMRDLTNPRYIRAMAVDPGFGSSPMGVVIVQAKDRKFEVCYADTLGCPSFSEAVNYIQELLATNHNIKRCLLTPQVLVS